MLVDRFGIATIGTLLQTLDNGQTIDQAIESRGLAWAEFETSVARRMGVTLDSTPRR